MNVSYEEIKSSLSTMTMQSRFVSDSYGIKLGFADDVEATYLQEILFVTVPRDESENNACIVQFRNCKELLKNNYDTIVSTVSRLKDSNWVLPGLANAMLHQLFYSVKPQIMVMTDEVMTDIEEINHLVAKINADARNKYYENLVSDM